MNGETRMRLRYERRAEILLEAWRDKDDDEVAERHGTTKRSIQIWRRALEDDPEFAKVFAEKKAFADGGWLAEYDETMLAGVRFVRTAATTADATDPDMLHAVAGAMKMLSEMSATSKLVDARISGQTQPNGTAAEKAAAGSGAVVQLKRAV